MIITTTVTPFVLFVYALIVTIIIPHAAAVVQGRTIYPDTQSILDLGSNHNNWTLRSKDGRYVNITQAKVPGDLISDLERSNIINDTYFETNFLKDRGVWNGEDESRTTRSRTWIYETSFVLPMDDDEKDDDETVAIERTLLQRQEQYHHTLVLEGIKMGASISFNGHHLGNVTDQFLRYVFDLSPDIVNVAYGRSSSEINHLSISFDPTISTDGRFMACSGGWDWADGNSLGNKYFYVTTSSRLWWRFDFSPDNLS